MTVIQAAQIAHSADIICKTGLGTVISEFTGGFEIRTSFGGPGIGKILKMPISSWILCSNTLHKTNQYLMLIGQIPIVLQKKLIGRIGKGDGQIY